MTYSRSRRRKRSKIEVPQDDTSQPETGTDVSVNLKDNAPIESDVVSSQEELTEEQTRKLEVWESFREEFFEGVLQKKP